MSVARLNFAHGSEAEHRETVARVRAASKARGLPVAILQDLSGPKIRLGELKEGRRTLEVGQEITLLCGAPHAEGDEIPVRDPWLAGEVEPGGPVLIGDGAVELEVIEVDGPSIRARVVIGGEISSAKGINAPGGLSARPVLK